MCEQQIHEIFREIAEIKAAKVDLEKVMHSNLTEIRKSIQDNLTLFNKYKQRTDEHFSVIEGNLRKHDTFIREINNRLTENSREHKEIMQLIDTNKLNATLQVQNTNDRMAMMQGEIMETIRINDIEIHH